MKKIVLFIFILSIGLVSVAQHARVSESGAVRSVPAGVIDLPELNPAQTTNDFANSKAVLENDLGQTR
ncbi:MAG: hypothetical protein WCI71_04795, partial [Bacteroidota bacterium]